jgi:hypothetical protein
VKKLVADGEIKEVMDLLEGTFPQLLQVAALHTSSFAVRVGHDSCGVAGPAPGFQAEETAVCGDCAEGHTRQGFQGHR